MKVAIVHDWLNGMRGGEKVLEALLELYPDSTIYTLLHEPGKVSRRIEDRPIVTSWMNRAPGVHRHYRHFLPLFPAAAKSIVVRGFDVVISSSHAVANWVRSEAALHVSYCHTPMRYLWDAEGDYRMKALERLALSALRGPLRRLDVRAAQRMDHFIANSEFVRDRIRRYYGRDAAVIHPPVDTDFFTPPGEPVRQDFYVAAGALVGYKRFDVILQAFNKLGKRLVVAGHGPELSRLRRAAGQTIEFLGWVSDAELRKLYRTAQGFVFAAREDFGMMPVEAMACGCPVLAFAGGGALETVRDGVNGIFFEDQKADAIAAAVQQLERASWPAEQVRTGVERFSREIFKNAIRQFIDARLSETAVPVASRLT